VLIFLRRTLAKTMFQSVLAECGAMNQFVSYLRSSGDKQELLEAEDAVAMIGESAQHFEIEHWSKVVVIFHDKV